MALQAHLGPRPIADYGFIGDMRGAALVASDTSIDWLCLKRFDDKPLLFSLLDPAVGGRCQVAIDGQQPCSTRCYLPGTNILATTLAGAQGSVTVTDFMAVAHLPGAGDTGPDSSASNQLFRLIECTAGSATANLLVSPRFDWGRKQVGTLAGERSVAFAGEAFHVSCSHPLDVSNVDGVDVLRATARLTQGQAMVLVLGQPGGPADEILTMARQRLAQTQDYWLAWSASCQYAGQHAQQVLRSALCLKLLTYAPTGALIAAPTTGLPEAVGGVRNWDYRLVWTRDASFSVSAFLNLGLRREAAEFLRFLQQADAQGEVVRVLYAIDGPVPEEETLAHLSGWRNSRPITTGNGAESQQQHEIYGELLAALNLYLSRHGLDGLCPSLREGLPAALVRLADAAIKHWRLPDQGIWELRGPARHLLHTKGMCWVALDRAIQLAPQLNIDIPALWFSERETIRQQCLERAWNGEIGALCMEFGGSDLDMSTLRLALMGFIDAGDPRMAATFAASCKALAANGKDAAPSSDSAAGNRSALPSSDEHGRDRPESTTRPADQYGPDLFYRYRFDDGLPGNEGAFAACSFWVAGMHTLCGRFEQANALICSMLERANDLGLFAEEFDPASGQQLGNFPQGFTHMAVIHEVTRLHDARSKHGQ
ncbi:MAG: glycoside hydrolase family 15 protein [Janthinobacterium lividum]